MANPDINPGRRRFEFTSPEIQTGPREQELIQVITKYEVPLLTKAWDTWGDQLLDSGQKRGWLVCGPTRITLSRLSNWETHVPLLQNGDPYTEEHMKLERVRLYDPGNPSDRMDHEALSYYSGTGHVLHIDPIWDVWKGDKQGKTGRDDLRGAVHVRRFRVAEYEEVLRSKYNLFPFDPEDERVKQLRIDHGLAPITRSVVTRYEDAVYTDQITGPAWTDDFNRLGTPLGDFIRGFIPEWTGIISSPDR